MHEWIVVEFDAGWFEQCRRCGDLLKPGLTEFQKNAVRVSKNLLDLSRQRAFYRWDNETFVRAQKFWNEINKAPTT
jgi:hypothetical protein